jgi:hypothetical protein
LVAPTAVEPHAEGKQAENGTELGFGKRSSFAFTVEDIFGVTSIDYRTKDAKSTDQTGFFPLFNGAMFGFHAIEPGGLTIGTGVGISRISETKGDNELWSIMLRPRLGYAVSTKKTLGFWLRTGPSFNMMANEDSSLCYANLSLEAYLVFTPVKHFGLMVGPFVDLPLVASSSSGSPNAYRALGLTFGLVFDSGETR